MQADSLPTELSGKPLRSQKFFSNWQAFQKLWGFPGGSKVKASASNAGDLGLIPGLGRSPGEGTSYPLQCSGLEEPGRAPWRSPRGHKEPDTVERLRFPSFFLYLWNEVGPVWSTMLLWLSFLQQTWRNFSPTNRSFAIECYSLP